MSDPITAAALRALTERGRLGVEEVADAAGLDPDVLRELLDMAGGVDDDGLGPRDVAYAKHLAAIADHIGVEALLRSTRVRARALAQVVVSDLTTIDRVLLAPLRDDGASPTRIAEAAAEATTALLPAVGAVLVEEYRRVLVHVLGLDLVANAVAGAGGATDRIVAAIGFVDLVGYTRLAAGSDPTELGAILREFEDLVEERVRAGDGHAHVVKLLGDAAMLLADDATTLAAVLLDVVDDSRLPDLPRRAGLAAGAVLVREGDYYGDVVNTAARLTAHARPWSVLADESLGEELAEGFVTKRSRKVELRGLETQRPVVVRPPSPPDDVEG
ncbi:MAG: adenylate/guanylate cyclase domain-containing protein [Actinomycetes bacterium]